MNTSATLEHSSRYLSLLLRHDPAAAGITLDTEGWTDIAELIRLTSLAGVSLDRNTLDLVVAKDDKKRFTVSPDGLRIRAAQGHSTPVVAIERESVIPPSLLYHGTAERFLPSILKEGLQPRSRHQVHLSGDVSTAVSVGWRHDRKGKVAVLVVDTCQMVTNGHEFYLSENGVWLTASVPPPYLTLSPSARPKTKPC